MVGCDEDQPQFPKEVRTEYIFDIDTKGQAYCFKYSILTLRPYKIQFQGVVPLTECAGLSGFLYKDRVLVNNWAEDTIAWAERQKKKRKSGLDGLPTE